MTAPMPAPPVEPETGEGPEIEGEITVESILAELQEIIDQASGRELTDDEVRRYEGLEKRLASVQRSNVLRERQRARMAPVNAGLMGMIQSTPRPSDELDKAFRSYLRSGRENADITHLRAQGESVGAAGGYTVPTGFRDKLVERMKAFGGIGEQAEQLVTATGETIQWPTIDDTANSGEVVAEGGTFSSQADLVFGTANLGSFMYMTGGGSATPLRLSIQLLRDAAFDIEAKVSDWLGIRLGRAAAAHMITGTGVQQPKGLTYGLTGIEIATNTGVVYNDLVEFIHSVDVAYRELGNCKWGFNDTSWKTIRKLQDSHGDPLWRPKDSTIATGAGGNSDKQRPMLLDYEVVIDNSFPNITGNDNTINWGAFGDFKEGYVRRRVRDVVVVVNPWTRAANAQVEYTAYMFLDAAPQNTNAYKALTGQA
jgi:HK97 family phage major capsid protein